MLLKNFFGEIESFQFVASPIMEGITDLYNFIMFYLIMILFFMSLILLINIEWTLFYYNKKE